MVGQSLDLNFQLVANEIDSIMQDVFYIAVAEIATLLVLLGILLGMTAILLKRMMDSLNLFWKVPQRDITRYFSHFTYLRCRFENSSRIS